LSTVSEQAAQAEAQLPAVIEALYRKFGESSFVRQHTAEGMPTLWVPRSRLLEILRYLRDDFRPRYEMLLDVTAIDERVRVHREGQPDSAFTVVYHLISFSGNADIRIKVALAEDDQNIPTVIPLWPAANWHEREMWDMFGINVEGHPNQKRIYTPPTWVGHPLRKDHPARATEMDWFQMSDDIQDREQEAMKFDPTEWGLTDHSDTSEYMFLNFGPNHPAAHGIIRFVLQLDGEYVINCVPDVGYHHRGAEKMGERQS